MKQDKKEISRKDAMQQYTAADDDGKKMLEVLFGKNFFTSDIMSRCTSVESAFKIGGYKMKEELPYANPKNNRQKMLNLVAMMDIVIEVLREGWVPDYDDSNQEKWFAIYVKKASGFVFSRSFYVRTSTLSALSSRLCLPTCELSDFFGKTFIKEINTLLTLKQK